MALGFALLAKQWSAAGRSYLLIDLHTSGLRFMSGNMPHAISPHDSQEEQDDLLIRQALDPENPFEFDRELEPGEKADDAIDFGDLSDNDLADDEDEGKLSLPNREVEDVDDDFGGLEDFMQDEVAPDLIKSEGPVEDELDDLFGDIPSSPVGDGIEPQQNQCSTESVELGRATVLDGDEHTQHNEGISSTTPELRAQGSSELPSQSTFRPASLQQLQQELFAMSGSGGGPDILPPPPENQEELLMSLWPKFKRGTVPNFMDLLPPKKTSYFGKKPPKPPKPVQPTKVSLELAYDQERSFRLSSHNNRRIQEDTDRANVITIVDATSVRTTRSEDEDMISDLDNEPIGGISWQDLQIACEDWEVLGEATPLTSERIDIRGCYGNNEGVSEDLNHDDLYHVLNDQPTKVKSCLSLG